MLTSAKMQGVDVELIGLGMDSDRYLFKIESLYNAVQRLPEGELVVCTDGFDVLYLQGADVIRARFLMYGAPVVFSAELCFTHQPIEWARFYQIVAQGARYRYLNAGCIVGYAGALRDILAVVRSYDVEAVASEAVRFGFFCDQTLFSKYLVGHQQGWAMDRWCQICWCTAGEWEIVLNAWLDCEGRLFNEHTQTTPALVHIPYRERYEHVLNALFQRLRDRNG